MIAIPLILGFELWQVIAAFALMLVVWGARNLIAAPLEAVLGEIPVIGGNIADMVTRGVDAAVNAAAYWLRTSVAPVVATIAAPVAAAVAAFGELINAVETIAAQLPAIWAGIAGAVGPVAARLVSLTVRVASLAVTVAAAAAHVASLAARLAYVTATLIPAAVAHALHAAEAFATTAVAAARAALTAAYRAGDAALHAAIVAEAAALTAARGDLLRLITGQGAVLTTAIAATATTLRGELRHDVGVLERDLAGLHVAVDPLAAAGVLTLIGTLTTELDTMRRECVDPMCNVMTPQLGLLNGLLDLGIVVSVLELAGAAIRDPQGTGAEVAGVAGTVHSLVADLADPILGAHL